MLTYLITHGADNDMTTWKADSPQHAVEQCLEHLGETTENSSINDVSLCTPVKNWKQEGSLYAYSSDGSYFGADTLGVAIVNETLMNPGGDAGHDVDMEDYLTSL